jgi:integrase
MQTLVCRSIPFNCMILRFVASQPEVSALVLPSKAPRTQLDNLKELEKLKAVFGHMPLDLIKPAQVREYIHIRGQTAKVRANREKALLSHMFNMAREWDLTTQTNPVAGVKGNRETGRDRYITDSELDKLLGAGDPILNDAVHLALLTGQRPADVLKMRRDDIVGGDFFVTQNKTGAKLRMIIEGDLLSVIERLLSRFHKQHVNTLLVSETGAALTSNMLRSRFERAREAAGVDFQFRDLRAKNATDTEDLAIAQKRLGHSNRTMTEHYVRSRIGERVRPLMRKKLTLEAPENE